jgi:uncharacterized protein (DUF1330 family)
MTAYIIYHQHKMLDADTYQNEYVEPARALINKHGGRQLVGGEYEVLEGDMPGTRIVVHEFPDMGALKDCYYSTEFQELCALRQRIAPGNLIITRGFLPD